MGHTELRYDLSETKHQVTLKLLEHLDGLIKLLASEKETWLRRKCNERHALGPLGWEFPHQTFQTSQNITISVGFCYRKSYHIYGSVVSTCFNIN